MVRKMTVAVLITAAAVMSYPVQVYAEEYDSAALEDAISSGQYDDLVDDLKQAIRDGRLSSEEDIQQVIDDAKDEYGVSVDPAVEQRAVDIIDKAREMGVDDDTMADMVGDIYDNIKDSNGVYDDISGTLDNIEDQVVKSATKAVKDAVKRTITDFFKDLAEQIKKFWGELISKWTA